MVRQFISLFPTLILESYFCFSVYYISCLVLSILHRLFHLIFTPSIDLILSSHTITDMFYHDKHYVHKLHSSQNCYDSDHSLSFFFKFISLTQYETVFLVQIICGFPFFLHSNNCCLSVILKSKQVKFLFYLLILPTNKTFSDSLELSRYWQHCSSSK